MEEEEEAAPPKGAAAARRAEERRKAKRDRFALENTTSSGKRPKYADSRFYFIPEHGRMLDGRVDTAHYAKLHAAIVAWVACNPGLSEEEMIERFWGHPKCVLRGLLRAMEAEGTLRRRTLQQSAPVLFAPRPIPSQGPQGQPDTRVSIHYFLSSAAHALHDRC